MPTSAKSPDQRSDRHLGATKWVPRLRHICRVGCSPTAPLRAIRRLRSTSSISRSTFTDELANRSHHSDRVPLNPHRGHPEPSRRQQHADTSHSCRRRTASPQALTDSEHPPPRFANQPSQDSPTRILHVLLSCTAPPMIRQLRGHADRHERGTLADGTSTGSVIMELRRSVTTGDPVPAMPP